MLYIVFYICLSFFCISCATVISPSGGEKDFTPPVILSVFPKNASVNFKSPEVKITFDEYVRIDDRSQINFFPEIKPDPNISTKGKSIFIKLDSELKNNTTYIIDFNNSIVDLNESNPLKDYQYVFSTGNDIDSCKLNGFIYDLKSNNKIENAIVGLFKSAALEEYDSLVKTANPYYYTFSDDEGKYNFSNLRAGDYILYSFKDLNLNKRYEMNESVSMPSEIKIDATHNFNLTLFIESNEPKVDTLTCFNSKIKKDSTGTGVVNLYFNQEVFESGEYIGELLSGDTTSMCFNINSKIKKINDIKVGEYSLRIFKDTNQNSLWDPGNIKKLSPPEPLKFFEESFNIKKDWEIDVILQ